jgi:hypothetical protein
MRKLPFVIWMLLCSITAATAQVSIGIGLPGISIGINLPAYPQLVRVPGYPVYYAPGLRTNYFFYDGLYWVYQRDNWYASWWYNGPWRLVTPEAVPLYVLRIPVRYYRQPPSYFRGWRSDAPPRWGEHWGHSWEQSHSGWDNWNRSSVPAPAPLPAYQRQYSGTRYPRVEQQQQLQSRNYSYQPQDAVVQQHYQAQRVESAPAPTPPQSAPPAPRQRVQPPPTSGATVERPPTVHAPPQQPRPAAQRPAPQPQQPSPAAQRPAPPPQEAAQREQQAPRSQGQAQRPAAAQAPVQQAPKSQGQGQGQGQGKGQERQGQGQGQDKGSQGKGSAHESNPGQDKGENQGR